MEALIALAAVVLAPVAVTSGVLRALRWSTRRGSPGASGRGRPEPPSLDVLVQTLGHLERRYRETEQSNAPGRAARLHGIALAYDHALRDCCLALGLPAPGTPPLGSVARLEVEAALAQRGLTW